MLMFIWSNRVVLAALKIAHTFTRFLLKALECAVQSNYYHEKGLHAHIGPAECTGARADPMILRSEDPPPEGGSQSHQKVMPLQVFGWELLKLVSV